MCAVISNMTEWMKLGIQSIWRGTMLWLSLIYAQSQCLWTEVGQETETNSSPYGATEEQVALECRLS